MHTEGSDRHLGVVLGKILAGAHTLVYSLHEREDGSRYARLSQYVRYEDTDVSVAGLALALGDRVVDIWKTTYAVPWYYIQLKHHWGTKRLRWFDLPISAHFGTWERMKPV